jgi:hypothetical protein
VTGASWVVDYPEWFEKSEWEIEAKGYMGEVRVTNGTDSNIVAFYDPHRLHQDVADEIRERSVFFERNIAVVAKVTRHVMDEAMKSIGPDLDCR